MKRFFINKYSIFPVVAISAALYCFSTGLDGGCAYLLWIAPVPLLLFNFYNTKTAAFIAAFCVVFISKVSFLSYFIILSMPPIAAVSVISLWSAACAGVFLLTKVSVSRLNTVYGIFMFPVLITALEYLSGLAIPDLSWFSLSYTQADDIFLIQAASIAGIYAITFMISLFASTLAFLLTAKENKTGYFSLILPVLILTIALSYGTLRIYGAGKAANAGNNFSVLCVDIERLATGSNIFDPANRDRIIGRYLELIGENCLPGLDCILLPEKLSELYPGEKILYFSGFSGIAEKNNCLITAGWRIKGSPDKNISSVFFPDKGHTLEYLKKYLVADWERTFASGNSPLVFDFKNFRIGTAVCKDMDFPDWIRKYSSADIMLVPAWDFRVDSRFHSRMAVMRGVENGFYVVRTAREGSLTVSDPYGRIIKENIYNKEAGEKTLSATFRVNKINTLYSKYGNWFGLLVLSAAFITAAYTAIKGIFGKIRLKR